MAAPAQERIGVNTGLEIIIQKTDRAGIVEKGLTVDAKSQEKDG